MAASLPREASLHGHVLFVTSRASLSEPEKQPRREVWLLCSGEFLQDESEPEGVRRRDPRLRRSSLVLTVRIEHEPLRLK